MADAGRCGCSSGSGTAAKRGMEPSGRMPPTISPGRGVASRRTSIVDHPRPAFRGRRGPPNPSDRGPVPRLHDGTRMTCRATPSIPPGFPPPPWETGSWGAGPGSVSPVAIGPLRTGSRIIIQERVSGPGRAQDPCGRPVTRRGDARLDPGPPATRHGTPGVADVIWPGRPDGAPSGSYRPSWEWRRGRAAQAAGRAGVRAAG